SRDKKLAPPEKRTGRPPEPQVCERCASVFSRRAWRTDRDLTPELLEQASWTVCPACAQVDNQEYWGRVVIRGAYAAEHEEAIRQRIQNVEERARFVQPQRRVVSAERDGDVFEVLTTSQKLAHRIARELEKAFHGRATYNWSDDGSLYAVWEHEEVRH
ncbi:MAG TPA: hypothetical protein VEB21_14230, partial [Terriglobales bacterium]|nr:hypothetical protein [Terriglobales bacterium]